MKVLISTSAGLGHILPVRPLALELRRRGHDLRWVVGPGNVNAVVDVGIEAIVAGFSETERKAELARRYPEVASLPGERGRTATFGKAFGEIAAPPVIEVVWSLVEDWRPDVMVHEVGELAAALVAAATGTPSVCHGFGEALPEPVVRGAGAAMAPFWEEAGLEADVYAGCYRGMYIDIYPRSLRGVVMDHIPRVQPCRPVDAQAGSGRVVYVTFGTLFNHLDETFRAAVRGAAAVADEVLVTIGSGKNARELGDVPDNVTVEQFIPQAEVLPRCSAVVCHGGSGTVLASLAHGLPLVCVPRGADQFDNAYNVARTGAGIAVVGANALEPDLRTAVDHVLRSVGPRAAAQRLAAEIARMPAVTDVAAVVETYAKDHAAA